MYGPMYSTASSECSYSVAKYIDNYANRIQQESKNDIDAFQGIYNTL